MPDYDLPALTAAVQSRLSELGGENILTIPCGFESHGLHHGIVVWRRTEDGALITHRFYVDADGAQIESGDYYMPGRLTTYEAIAKGCERAAGHIG